MPSQFFGLNVAYTGLTASNAALNTTANNISNSETKGYSRQEAIQQANLAIRTYTTYGSAGAGVDTIAIERIHDDFYDEKYWDNNAKLGNVTAKAYYMKTIENYFMDTDTNSGFNTTFNLMFNALEELSKNAGDAATKAQFAMYTQSFVDYFNSTSNELKELQKDVNTEIKDIVSEINSIAEQIATLNKQINVIELTGAKANELRDSRNVLIDELSNYVSVETSENPIYDANNNFETGATRFIVRIAGGQMLVDTNDYQTLQCVAREVNETVSQNDAVGLYDIRWANGNDFNIYSANLGGKLQGLVELRDGNNTENFRGTITSVDVPNNTVTVKVTLDQLHDLDKCTLSQTGGTIKLGAEVYYYTDWTYIKNQETGEVSYEFQLDNNFGQSKLSNSRIGKEAMVGVSVDYQGIPYYQEQVNEFVRLFARTFNDIITQEGAVDSYGNAATRLFLADNPVGDLDQLTFNDYYTAHENANTATGDDAGLIKIHNYDDTYYKLTAGNLAVNREIAMDSKRLATHTGATDGDSKNNIVNELINMKTDKTILDYRGASASEFLQSVLSDVALNAARANNSEAYYNTMSNTINNQRISISGVDSDDEAVALVKYQNAYALASKMIQTFTEIYDRLILQTGV